MLCAFAVERQKRMSQSESRLLCRSSSEVADARLRAADLGRNLWLSQLAPLLDVRDDDFPVHGVDNIGQPLFYQADTRYRFFVSCVYGY